MSYFAKQRLSLHNLRELDEDLLCFADLLFELLDLDLRDCGSADQSLDSLLQHQVFGHDGVRCRWDVVRVRDIVPDASAVQKLAAR